MGNSLGGVGVGDDCGVVEGEPSAEPAEDPEREVVRAKPNRDGDLDMDRRSERTVAVMST